MCISDRFSGDAGDAGPEAALQEALVRGKAEHERASERVQSHRKNSINKY